MSEPATWETEFSTLFNKAVEKHRAGHQKPGGLVDAKGQEFLKSIGCSEQEFFDFVDDFVRRGEPGVATALKIAAVRRDYFLTEQKGKPSSHQIDMAKLPSKDAKAEGIDWLPRLLAKAEAKLHGEMPPDLMFGCGGDFKFFKTHQLDPADFLREVWKAKGNHNQVVAWVKKNSQA